MVAERETPCWQCTNTPAALVGWWGRWVAGCFTRAGVWLQRSGICACAAAGSKAAAAAAAAAVAGLTVCRDRRVDELERFIEGDGDVLAGRVKQIEPQVRELAIVVIGTREARAVENELHPGLTEGGRVPCHRIGAQEEPGRATLLE